MSTTAGVLLGVGGFLEFAGIIAIAWPDLITLGERVSSWLRRAYGRMADRVRRSVGRPRPGVVHQVGGGGAALITHGVKYYRGFRRSRHHVRRRGRNP